MNSEKQVAALRLGRKMNSLEQEIKRTEKPEFKGFISFIYADECDLSKEVRDAIQKMVLGDLRYLLESTQQEYRKL